MTQQRPENNASPAGFSGNSATVAWDEKKPDAPPAAEVAEVALSADADLDQIEKLIGRIHSTSATAPLAAPAALAVTTPFVAPTPAAPDEPSGPHGDAALQDYMDQFLERVTGKKKPDPEGSATPSAAALSAPFVPPGPEKPRDAKRAPESVRDMSEMRALANESARRALGAHAGQRLIAATRSSFLGALSLSLISSLLAATSLMGQIGWAWYGAVLVMLPALVLTVRFLLIRGQLQELNGALRNRR